MLSRLVGRRASVIWYTRLSTKWMSHSFGRRVVMPLPTLYTLLDAHNIATVISHVSRAQYTAAAKVPTTSLQNTTSKQQEILMLNKDLIFVGLQASNIDYRLALMYVRLKIGHIERALGIYRRLIASHPNQKERLNNVNIYNAFIEAYMKRGGRSTRQALYWLGKMRKQQIKPNLTTYAILIKGFLRSGSIDRAHTLLIEMLKEGYSIIAFMINKNTSNDDLRRLNLIHRAKGETVLRFH
jgi:pentatricopeptide repeat protein